MSDFSHQTVLLEEAVAALNPRADGIYLDGTFGRGGHSRLLLSKLGPEGRLIGHLGRWLELLQPARKRPEQTQSASRRTPITLAPLGLPRPGSHHLDGERSAVTGFPDMAREPAERLPHVMKLEPEAAPLGQVLLDPVEKG